MSFDLFTSFATDEATERNGAWRDIGGGASLLIARSGTRQHARMLTAEVERNRATLDLKNDVAEDKSDEIMVKVMAETILLGWKGVSFKGADLPYSKENARLVLGMRDFRALVQKLAEEAEAYRAKLEVEQGNA